MTVDPYELDLDAGLLAYLDEHDLRYEVLDGAVVVSPPAGFRHEDVTAEILARLRVAAPPELAVLASNFAFRYGDGSFVLPDVQVVRRADCDEDGTKVAPLLVVEVLSRSTRRRDLSAKWEIYAEAGVPSYWLVDPVEPSMTVLTLAHGLYVETARTTGRDELELALPFAVRVRLLP